MKSKNYLINGEEFVPCPSLSLLPPMAKIANPITARIPRIGAERLVIAAGAPEEREEKSIDE